jgi:hypothetical protein
MIAPPSPGEEIVIDGVVVDMSYSGIKIKLEHPLHQSVEQGELLISIRLPESGVPLSIHGMIRHLCDNGECGLQYAGQQDEQSLDDLMFECVKHAPHGSDE